LGTELLLVCGTDIVHLVDLVAWPNIVLRVTVTVEAVTHEECLGLPDHWHLIYTPVAFRATNPLVDVNRVIEIDKIRDAIHLLPKDGFAAGITLTN
jgi:hypothetical protein